MMNTHLMPALVMLQTWLTHPTRRDERGSVSVEQAIITGAVVMLAALVVAADHRLRPGQARPPRRLGAHHEESPEHPR